MKSTLTKLLPQRPQPLHAGLWMLALTLACTPPSSHAGARSGKRLDYAALALADQMASQQPLPQAPYPTPYQTSYQAPQQHEQPLVQPRQPKQRSNQAELEALHRAALDDLPATGAGGRMSVALTTGLPKPVLVSGKNPRDPEARFDLSVSNASAPQVFLQLGAGTAYNILISPELTGSVSVGLKNTTVPEAMEVMRELFGYDFRIDGNNVFVYPNTVQTRIFKINYLPGRRQGASDLRVSSSSIALGEGKGSSGSSGSGGSAPSGGSGDKKSDDTSHVRMTSDSDFWSEIKESLVTMVGTAGGRSVVMNPGAGVIVVRATPAEHRHVTDFLKAVQLTIERQVMLEAKIVEVALSNESQTGVNWTMFKGTAGKNLGAISSVAPGISLSNGAIQTSGATITPGSSIVTDTLGRGLYGVAIQATNFTALISFLQTQGDVQVLSSPRIATINNQKAILKVGSDELFVTGVTTNSTTNGSTTTSTPSLTLQPFFSGISLDVTPQIDDTGTVMLHVHPSVSVVTEKQKVIDLGQLGSYKLPLATSAINETDSIVRVKDGHIVAIGGLMREASSSDKSGVPGLSNVPVMGNLFSQKTTVNAKRELVILIKPTVISDDGAGWSSTEPSASLISPVIR